MRNGRRKHNEQENKKAAVVAEANHSDEVVAEANHSDEQYLTTRQVVALVGYTETTLWRWMCAGKFPRPKKAGGRRRWRKSDIDKWFNEQPEPVYKGDKRDEK